jgi:hypothetical protein
MAAARVSRDRGHHDGSDDGCGGARVRRGQTGTEQPGTPVAHDDGHRGRTVLQAFGSGEDYVFVGNVFMDVLTRHEVKTIAAAPPSASAAPETTVVAEGMGAAGDLVLTYQNVAFAIAYPDVYRSHLVGGKRVKRRADIRVHATVTDAKSGEVLWVGEASRESSDEFDFDDAARVEQGVYQFARPVIPGGGWGKYAEPVFVTGIIVGLIYLFFSNQSDN